MAKLKFNNESNQPLERDNKKMRAKVIELKNYQRPYRLTMCQWDGIRRANNPSKGLSHNALKVLTNVVYKLRREKVVTVSHAYLTDNLTRCKYGQNNNILDELRVILDIKFNRSGTIDGKRYRDRFEIRANKNTYKILENPELFYAEESASNPLRNSDTTRKKMRDVSQFYETAYIYNKSNTKEEIGEIPKYLSSISKKEKEEKEKREESVIDAQKASLHCCEAASNPPCFDPEKEVEIEGKVSKQEQPVSKILPLTAEIEQELHQQRLQRASNNSKSENDYGFKSVAGIFSQIQAFRRESEGQKGDFGDGIDNSEAVFLEPILEPTTIMDQAHQTANSEPQLQDFEDVQTNEINQTSLPTSDASAMVRLTTPNEEENNVTIPLKPTTNQLWDKIRQKALASLENEAERWVLKYDLNDLEVSENQVDSTSQLEGSETKIQQSFEFKGPKATIKNLRESHFKAFTESFYAVAPNHTFTFIERL